jgi:Gram-negative bacterial TonB protein C-terminal
LQRIAEWILGLDFLAEKSDHMRRNSKLLVALLSLACAIFAATRTEALGGSHFQSPDIIAATDIPYPFNSIGSGLVSISVNLTAGGQVQNVQVVRDVPGLTAIVTTAINSWKFSPGKLDGNAVPSTINVQVVFNPSSPQNQNLQILPGPATTAPNPPGYFPPQMSQASYAVYPPNSIATGAVVLDLVIDKYSEVKKVTPIRSVPSLTAPAIAAVKSWTVNPATLNEKKLDAKLVVAFVFRSPTT